jgi:hypothetical protein
MCGKLTNKFMTRWSKLETQFEAAVLNRLSIGPTFFETKSRSL